MMDHLELDQLLEDYIEILEDTARPAAARLIAARRQLAGLDPAQVAAEHRDLVDAMLAAVAEAHAEAGLDADDEAAFVAADPDTLQALCLDCEAEASGLQAELMIRSDPSLFADLVPSDEALDLVASLTHQIGLWLLAGKGKKSAAKRLQRSCGCSKAQSRDLIDIVHATLVDRFGKAYDRSAGQERERMVEEWDLDYGEDDDFEETEVRELSEAEARSLAKEMEGWGG